MIFVKSVPVPTMVLGPNGIPVSFIEQDSDVAIKFYHSTQPDSKNRGRFTRCELIAIPTGTNLTRENGMIIGEGETKVFSGNWKEGPDRFDRRIGRYEAFKRAVNTSDLNREVRASLWDAYRAKCKMPPKSYKTS